MLFSPPWTAFFFSVTAGAVGQAEAVEVEGGRLGVRVPVELHPETGELVG